MEVDFVTFELANKLKEKGFNDECHAYYEPIKHCLNLSRVFKTNSLAENYNCITAPTIAQVLKWLREKGIHAQIEISPLGWYGTLYTFSKDEKGLYDINDLYICIGDIYDNYEKAALCTIEYVLNNLI